MTTESERGKNQVQTFLAMLQSQPTEADCQRCIEQLNDYVDAQLAGSHYQTEFPFVTRHLDNCVACADAYARVYELELAEQNGRLPQPVHIPDPDLSFLGQSANLWAALQTALQHTQERLTLQLDSALAALLAPQPSLAMTRSTEDARFGAQILSLTPEQVPETTLPFSLAAYADKKNAELCLVEITVEPPGQSWPDLGGKQVQLRFADVLHTETTDDWGTAVFPDIPRTELENLHFDISL